MRIPITRKTLVDWGGADAVASAESIVGRGMVLEAEYDPPWLRGAVIRGNQTMDVSLRILPNGLAENHCPCYDNQERGLICAHALALGLTLVKRATDPLREAKYQEEKRRAARLASFREEAYISRVTPNTPGAVPAALRLSLGEDWRTALRDGTLPLRCEIEAGRRLCPVDRVPRDAVLSFDKADENLLYVIEDICEGPARSGLEIRPADFVNILHLLEGRRLLDADGHALTVNKAPMQTVLRLDLDHETGEMILIAHTELPFLRAGEFPLYIVPGRTGWVYASGHFWPLANVLPGPYRGIYTEPVIIERPDVVRFFKQELAGLSQYCHVETDLSFDLFTIDPAEPAFRLDVQGSPASLSARLFALYDGIELAAAKPDAREHFALPDPEDFLRYTVRNPAAEQRALRLLQATGFVGACGDDLSPIVGSRAVLNFLAMHRPALRRWGWQITFTGGVTGIAEAADFVVPVVRVQAEHGTPWFDISFDFEGGGASISQADIQRALRKGDAFIERDGRTLLIDSQAIDDMLDVFSDCDSGAGGEAGHFRMNDCYAAFVKASLDALDGVDVEADAQWRRRAEAANRTLNVEPVQLPPHLDTVLRGYQKDGVSWLRFLESSGFCGILADEMGLGKTLQTLTWIQMRRHAAEARDKPVLIVCPSSLVDNWAAEARKFVPELRRITMSGAQRHDAWDTLGEHDLVVTSYALLRRDLDRYVQYEFAAVVLDEAQHIKNRSTQNAKAAKQLRAFQRLVLTGTPVENGVSDLWSIMDFLMPGYLGHHRLFRERYEQPISHPGEEGVAAQARLRRKLRPFLLRRLKTDVARELPEKIERVSLCALSPDQTAVYRELLNQSRRRITELVSTSGFQRARMEILTTLLRLRQACCHLDLLKLPDLQPKEPSAKLDQCFELLDEAIDSGHRVLLFSQFVSMLHILRDAFEARGWDYCYLDGSTKNRLAVVHRFNTRREIPVFLISLKAGGTGLNLTGADMVIHFDPWWNPAVENQATDRAHRIGQHRSVYSIKLITSGTVEEKVLEMQQRKQSVIDATLESDERMMQSMTWEDVQELLSL